MTQEFSFGLLAGEQISLQILDQPGNSTAPLLSIADLANLGAVMDLAEGTISIRGRAPHKLPKTKTGLTLIPVTKKACERWKTEANPSLDAFVAVTGSATEHWEETGAPCREYIENIERISSLHRT